MWKKGAWYARRRHIWTWNSVRLLCIKGVKGPFRCLHTAAAAAPLARLLSPSPTHFVARVTLTLNSQVGRCRGRDAEAVAWTAGVFPGILRLDPEDDEGAVDEDAHSELQITAERCRHSVRQADQHDGAVISLSLSPFSFFSLSCRHEILKGAMWEQQRVKPRPSWDPENTESRARDSNTSVNCHFVYMVQPLIQNHGANNNMTLCTSFLFNMYLFLCRYFYYFILILHYYYLYNTVYIILILFIIIHSYCVFEYAFTACTSASQQILCL